MANEIRDSLRGILGSTLPGLLTNPDKARLSDELGALIDQILAGLREDVDAFGNGSFRGVWDADTNTPTLASSVGSPGDFYIVSVAGTTTLNGISSWDVGDQVRFTANGDIWVKIEGVTDLPYIDAADDAIRTWTRSRARVQYNGFDPMASDVVASSSLNTSTGARIVSAGNFVTGMMPIRPGEKVWLRRTAVTCFYDADYGFISGIGSTAAGNSHTAPTGAAFVRMSFSSASLAFYDVDAPIGGTALPTVKLPYGGGSFNGHWSGKAISFLGDSFTAPDVYTVRVCTLLNAFNIGFSDDALAGRQMAELPALLTDGYIDSIAANLCVIWLGQNDFGDGPQPLGTIGDTAATNSFYGSCRSSVEKILTRKVSQSSTMRLMLVTPTKCLAGTGRPAWDEANGVGAYMVDYADALLEIGEAYSLPVCDMFRVSGINDITIPLLTYDGFLHPNSLGNDLVSQRLAGFISGI